MLHELQSRFRRAVTRGDNAALLAVMAGGMPPHIAPGRRIAVHRNTYFGSLIEALQAAYPVVAALVGERFFAMAARAFIEAEPPQRPDLAAYGGGFGPFLANFPPAAGVPYLCDVARLEWARVEATFAAEAAPLDPAALAAVAPERIPALVLTLHPSLRLVSAEWAIQSVWDAHQFDPIHPFDPAAGAERVLVLRPAGHMVARRLSVGEAALLRALMQGRPLGEAAGAGLAAEPSLDLQTALALLLGDGAIIGFLEG